MRSIGSDIATILAKSRVSGGLALRVARNNAAFARSVRRTWADNPAAATFILAHVSSLYFKRESPEAAAVRGAGSYGCLGVYLDDPMARAELNARREILSTACRSEGLDFDELRIHASVRSMRDRRAFEDPSRAGMPPAGAPGRAAGPSQAPRRTSRDASAVLQDFKRAAIMAFGSAEMAATVLDEVQAAALEERWASDYEQLKESRRKKPAVGYWVHLFVAEGSRATVAHLFSRYHQALRARCLDAGLRLEGVAVHASSPEMAGHHAFPRSGHPRVLRNADQRRLRALRCETENPD